MALVTLQQVRDALPQLAGVSDAEVTRRIAAASAMIEKYCRATFGDAVTETFDADGTGVVWLRSTPVASITSVTVGLPDDPAALSASDYALDPLTGELRLYRASWDGFWPAGAYYPWVGPESFQSIRVVYSTADVPDDVADICLSLISRRSSGLAAAPGVKSKAMGHVTVTYTDGGSGYGLSSDDLAALAPHRRLSL